MNGHTFTHTVADIKTCPTSATKTNRRQAPHNTKKKCNTVITDASENINQQKLTSNITASTRTTVLKPTSNKHQFRNHAQNLIQQTIPLSLMCVMQ